MSCLAPTITSVRDFIPEVDAVWLHRLWHRTMHERWAISISAMLSRIRNSALLLVAECGGLPSGFCAVDLRGQGSAGLTLFLVEPDRQGSGVGTELMRLVESRLRTVNIRRLTLGAGSVDYFWPGLPREQEDAWPFFRARGFVEEESSEDLSQDLQTFATPAWVSARLASFAETSVGEPVHQSRILAFERLYFPAWADYYRNEMEQGGHSNVVFAQGPDGSILGTLLIRHDTPMPWTAMFGTQIGTLNVLGVAPEWQGRGIGLALTAHAMGLLKERGCVHCLIQWTGLTEWYGKLGATSWAQYRMAGKNL